MFIHVCGLTQSFKM